MGHWHFLKSTGDMGTPSRGPQLYTLHVFANKITQVFPAGARRIREVCQPQS